jgi:hypothetical protein
MHSELNSICRVCGLLQPEPPWGKDGRTPSFNICDCCGVEFGYEDCTLGGILNYRNEWLSKGAKWGQPKARPQDWALDKQMRQIPLEFK